MKPAFAFLTMVVVLVGLSGCNGLRNFLSPHGHCLIDGSCGHCSDCPETCQSCEPDACGACGVQGCDTMCEPCGDQACYPQGCGLLDRLCARKCNNPGPATGAVTYPYYTTRGPRDYFLSNPNSVGP